MDCTCGITTNISARGSDAHRNCGVHGRKITVVQEGAAPGTPMWYERKIRELETRNEALELAASCAQDVVDFWPSMSMRTIRIMIPKMESLKQALELAKK